MLDFIKKVLPNLCLILSVILMTLFITDLINPTMAFINNVITKIGLGVFSVLVGAESVLWIREQRKK